jgi:hypothetical protein
MLAVLKKPVAYLGASFILFMAAPVLISIGTTGGPRALLWMGLAALCIGGLIPPVQRLICGSMRPSNSKSPEEKAQ